MTLIQRLSIAKAGGVRPLLELARTGSKQTREQAMWALWRASFTEEQKVAILETDALPLLVLKGRPSSANVQPYISLNTLLRIN